MGLEFNYNDGQTPLSEEEKEGLRVKTITIHDELNALEQLNIEKAMLWTIKTRFKKDQILTEKFIRKLHKQMFGDVWLWAGSFRTSEKNIGVKWRHISIELKTLLDDTIYWIENHSYSNEEIAIRFKHRLVKIHCFPIGNGRHSRMMADIIIENIFGKPVFSWNQFNMIKADLIRKDYINSLKEGDMGNIQDLLNFAKS